MLETLLKLYSMAMATGARSPVPHLFGPPGCGKSEVAQTAADLIGVKLHVLNVSRMSPLELEGVQMPVPHEVDKELVLKLLTATFWTQLNEGDILLFDEFLRGFPEVYNGLLDIFTSRNVAGYQLPNVFIVAASNSVVSYDKALEDRLMHLPVPDPRKSTVAKAKLAELIVERLGLYPLMTTSMEMQTLIDVEVLPMYEILDNLKNRQSSAPATVKGQSIRKLIGQAQLRHSQSTALSELIKMNNVKACNDGKLQYVFLFSGRDAVGIPSYAAKAAKLKGNPRLTALQAQNLDLNLQLIQLEADRHEKGTDEDVADIIDDDPF